MRKGAAWLALATWFVLGFRTSTGQPVQTDPSDAAGRFGPAIEQGRAIIEEWMANQGIPGLSVAVIKDSVVIWSEGFGYADLEQSVPASPKTRYRIGSVSKLLTAAGLARLVERNRIDLDAPVQSYVPAFPHKEGKITPRLLAGHLSGLRHYKRGEYMNSAHLASVAESLNVFKDDPLVSPPGTKYAYSSFGYLLLSAAIESAAKLDFLAAMSELVFAPAKMDSTAADDFRAIIPGRSRFYGRTEAGESQNESFQDVSDRWAAGGFLSTAADLAAFGDLHLRPGFLNAEMLNLIFTPQKTSDGKETGVGLGWRIGKDAKGRRILHHGGDSIGGRAFLAVFPESGVVIAITANLSFARIAEAEASRLLDLFL